VPDRYIEADQTFSTPAGEGLQDVQAKVKQVSMVVNKGFSLKYQKLSDFLSSVKEETVRL
jgi:hypothetical protein